MSRWKSLVGLIPTCAMVLAGQAGATTLSQAVQETVNSNPNILIRTNTRIANEHAVRNAQADYLPSVDLNAGIGRERSKNPTVAAANTVIVNGQPVRKRDYETMTRKESGIQLNQLIFDGFGTPYEVSRRKSELCASAYDLNAGAQDVALEAVTAYLDVLKFQELVALAKRNVEAHVRTFDMIKRRSSNGIGRRADLESARGRLALAKSNLQARESSLRDVSITYARIVGRAPMNLRLSRTGYGAVPRSREHALSMALANHPRIKMAHWDIEEAEAQHGLSKSLFWPRLDFQAGASWNVNMDGSRGTNNDYYAMLRANYNVLRGGGDLARKRETAVIIQRTREIMNRTRRQVSELTKLSWNALVTARGRLVQLRRHRESANETLMAYRKQFKLGKRTLLDMLDQENEMFNASNAVVEDKFVEVRARYRLLNATGQLIQSLHVALPPEAYCEEEPSTVSPAVEEHHVSDKAKAAMMMQGGKMASAKQAMPAKDHDIIVSNPSKPTNMANAAQAKQWAKQPNAQGKPEATRAQTFAANQGANTAAKPAAQVVPVPAPQQVAKVNTANSDLPAGTTIITPEGTQIIMGTKANKASNRPNQATQKRSAGQWMTGQKPAAAKQRTYAIQAGTFSKPGNAKALVAKLQSQGFNVYTHKTNGARAFTKVMVVPPQNTTLHKAKATMAAVEDAVHASCMIVHLAPADANA